MSSDSKSLIFVGVEDDFFVQHHLLWRLWRSILMTYGYWSPKQKKAHYCRWRWPSVISGFFVCLRLRVYKNVFHYELQKRVTRRGLCPNRFVENCKHTEQFRDSSKPFESTMHFLYEPIHENVTVGTIDDKDTSSFQLSPITPLTNPMECV